MKIKSVINAMIAGENKQQSNFIDAVGIFDNISAPLFPFPFQNLSLILTVEEIAEPCVLELRLNSPNDELIGSTNFGIVPDSFGVGKKIINLDQFLATQRGKYTLDLFQVVSDQSPVFIGSETVFVADYPPKRIFAKGEKEKIINTENVIKSVKFEFLPPELAVDKDAEPIRIQYSLDKNEELAEGHIEMPEEDFVEVKGHKIEIIGIKNHIEWFFGRPLPEAKQPEENVEEKKEEHKCCGTHEHKEGEECSCGHKHKKKS